MKKKTPIEVWKESATTNANRVIQLEAAASFAASVLKAGGLYDLSERIAYNKLLDALKSNAPRVEE